MHEDRTPHPNPPTAYHGPNPIGGRDLVVADLHGELDTLEEALKSLEFRPAFDRLFTLGNLIDRGPRSADAMEWLTRGKFAGGVRGNHEQMLFDAFIAGEADTYDEDGPGALWRSHGGDWWYDSQDEAEEGREHLGDRWCDAIEMLPYMTTIDYGDRRIGLVHSDGATDLWRHWSRIEQWAEQVCEQHKWKPTPRAQLLQHDMLWRAAVTRAATQDDPKLRAALQGVDLVLSGHNPAFWPTWTRANALCIDTGVHYEAQGHLTIAETQDGLQLHRFARVDRI